MKKQLKKKTPKKQKNNPYSSSFHSTHHSKKHMHSSQSCGGAFLWNCWSHFSTEKSFAFWQHPIWDGKALQGEVWQRRSGTQLMMLQRKAVSVQTSRLQVDERNINWTITVGKKLSERITWVKKKELMFYHQSSQMTNLITISKISTT